MKITVEYEPGDLERSKEIVDDRSFVLAVPEGETQSLSFKVTDRVKANWFLIAILNDKTGKIALDQCGIKITEVHFDDLSRTNTREMVAEIIDVVNRHTSSNYQLIT